MHAPFPHPYIAKSICRLTVGLVKKYPYNVRVQNNVQFIKAVQRQQGSVKNQRGVAHFPMSTLQLQPDTKGRTANELGTDVSVVSREISKLT